jgi:hypothetical protein
MEEVMKRVFRLGAAMAFLVAVGACSDGPATVSDQAIELAVTASYDFGENEPIELYAGQNTLVGHVLLAGDPATNGSFSITYNITEPGWCLTETHWHIGDDGSDIPQNRKGNPKIGHFMGGEEEVGCTTSETYTLDTGIGGTTPWAVAAHAVVAYGEGGGPLAGKDVLFGIENGPGADDDGDLYAIDRLDGSLTLLYDFDTDPSPTDPSSPNGLATDAANERLYFAVNIGDHGSDNTDLYYYNLDGSGDPVLANSEGIPYSIYNATFANGQYWFVDQNTDDLYVISFQGDGTVDAVSGVCPSFWTGDDPVDLQFGDIVAAGGIIHGVARIRDGNVYFFLIDLADCSFTSFDKGGDYPLMQIALSSIGELYGHAGGTGQWYLLNPANGDITSELFISGAFTDISSGVEFDEPEYEYETAWALGGNPFVQQGGSWAEWFYYNYEAAP